MKCFTAEMLAKDEPEFLRVLEGRAKDNGKLKIIDISKKEKEVEVKETTLTNIYEVIGCDTMIVINIGSDRLENSC